MSIRPLQIVAIALLTLSCATSSLYAAEGEIGTYDTLHLIPPIYARDGLSTSNDIRDHYLYLSTNETLAFDVTIRNKDNSVNQIVNISKSSPGKITLSAGVYGTTAYGAMNIVNDAGLNVVNTNDGLILTAGSQFYANLRHISGSQGASLTSKGQTAFGKRFRSGHLISTSAQSVNKSSFISVMAAEDNTAVTFNLPAGVTFVGAPPVAAVILDQYESYTIGVKADESGNATADGTVNGMINIVFNRLNGTLVTSDKAIVMNSGSFLGGPHDGNTGGGRDIGIDQIVPTAYLGTEFIVIKGGATTNAQFLETPVIVADTNNTAIFLKGSETAIATINAGEYYVVSGTEYPVSGSMFIRTSQPVYLYQNTSSNDTNGNGLNAVAAIFNNLEVQDVLIPEVEQVGSPTISVIAPTGTVINVNGVALVEATDAVFVPGKENYVLYSRTGDTGNVDISGDKPFFVTMHSNSGNRGSAGYFVGFPNSYAVRDNTTTAPVTSKVIDVQANDISGPFTFTVSALTVLPTNGNAVLNGDGTVTYTPDPGFFGEDTFEYEIDNGAGLTDTTIVTVAVDSDGDGVGDVNDLDVDNDGIPDTVEGEFDTDGDGIKDKYDLDSDNDGIFDLVEAGHGQPDVDENGKLDGFDGDNGLADAVETSPESGVLNYVVVDTDVDTTKDYLDLDGDNDGIPDNVEAQASDAYIAPTASVNADGVDSAYPSGITVYDTDGDTVPDYIDLDSDNLGGLDAAEKGVVISSVTYADVNGDFSGFASFADTDGDFGAPIEGTPDNDVDFRDATGVGAIFTIDAIDDTTVNENSLYTSVTPAITGIPGSALTYTLGGVDAGLFSIDAVTGVVSMIARDFELPADSGANNVYDLTITATDSGADSDTEAWSVTVIDIMEADVTPPVITLIGASPIDFERGLSYFDVGATATDNIDDDAVVTANIVVVNPVDGNVAGTYFVTYNVSDAANNPAIPVTRTVNVNDTVAPGISILNQPASVNNLDVFTVTFQFTEIVNGFDITDITFANAPNATVNNFVNVGGIGDTYTVDVKPTGIGDISIGVNANVAQDPSANNNTAAITNITVFDNTPPVVVVTSAPDINIANQLAYPVSGTCTVGDGDVFVRLYRGALFFDNTVSCSAAGIWSIIFDGSAPSKDLSGLSDTIGSGIPTEVSSTQTDGAGNVGTSAAAAIVIDTVKPSVQIQNAPAIVNASEFTISIVFDEDVTGFDSSDVSVINGAVNAASFAVVDAQTYTIGIVPDSGGNITLNVAANVALDLAGNDNNAALPVLVAFDSTAPSVTIIANVINAANDDVYTVSGGCDNGGSDVTVSIAGAIPVTQDVSCTAGNWTADFDVTPINDGVNAVTINASQVDAANNTGNAIPAQIDKDVVITVPTVNVLVTNNTTPVITGTADTSTSNEITVAGATYTVIATVGNVWSLDTAVVIPDSGAFILANGANDVAVVSTDAVGNTAVDASTSEVILGLDDDNDGIPNIVECPSGAFDNTCPDADGDGIPDFQEIDSDNDGIPDAVEVGVDGNNPIDSDGDGIPDYRDTDSDGDGIDDALEAGANPATPVDSDGDGIPDYVEVGNTSDSDGDGIPDAVECPVYPNCPDTDGDNQPDYLEIDSDDDGIGDAVEAGVDPTLPIDTDADGIPDYQDSDSDEDGAIDSVEGVVDTDGDGIPDYVDVASAGPAPNAGDSDGDGIADNIECELYPLCADSDNDSTPDYMETDSDNDGISDADETGTAINDADNDGIDDVFDIDLTGGIDQNGDGIDDTQPLDTDGDGTPDYQDVDSDGDGIDDVVECAAGVPCPDADADGIPDQLDASNGDASGTDLVGAGDSDGDGISDFDECSTGIPCTDVDRDGLPDYMDNNPDDGPVADPDNDGRLNYLDPDDDDDTIPDVVEDPNFDGDDNPATNPLDSDLDGTPDYLDSDSDNDGISDAEESGSSQNDDDGDNIDDSYDTDITSGTDVNGDGIDDDVLPLDSDGDTLPDYLDIVFDGNGEGDTDGDGIADNVECPTFPTDCPDTDGDGLPDFREIDSDNDGLGDALEAGVNPASPIDTDGDGTPDYRDTDSDNDGLNDGDEGVADVDNDGIPDYVDADTSGAAFGGDSDGDGVEDLAECESYPNCADSDNDGTPDYMDADSRPYNPDAAINTGLNGVGGNGPWTLLLIPATLFLRRKIRVTQSAQTINKK